MKRKTVPVDYKGIHMEPFVDENERRKRISHDNEIHLFEAFPDLDETRYTIIKLTKIVKVYKHRLEDFEFNGRKIIELYKRFYGDPSIGEFTIAQPVKFKVMKNGKVFQLPLFKFFMNYVMLILPIELGIDLSNWNPWTPVHWSNNDWCNHMDSYIRQCRTAANMRKLCECIELTKYLLNLWVDQAGERIGLSISNHEFIEVMKRSKEAYESISCSFHIPEGITPSGLEDLTMERTKSLLKIIGEQTDLSISVYARNNLFNPIQFREYAVHICHKPTLSGTTIPYTYPTNIMMGIKDPRAFMVDARGGRKAEITKLNVSDAGTLERALMMLMSPVRYVDINYECESQHFRKRYIGGVQDLDKLDGRVFTRKPGSDKYYILDPKNVDLIGKTIYLKTPITCTHPRRADGYICSACYGKLMASLNRDLHIGRVAAADSADQMEQKLLSAKHALKTDTAPVEFPEIFYKFFDLGNGRISMNHDMYDAAVAGDEEFTHLYFEFYPETMGKHKDGESRHFDRSFSEIVIYDDRDDSRINIPEVNGADLYLSPEFNNDHFLPAIARRREDGPVRIPFTDVIDGWKIVTKVIFEFNYANSELAKPLLTLERIMFNAKTIGKFSSYDECIDTIIPLFMKGGIHIPDYQTELLVSRLIIGSDGRPVDWTLPNPEYQFQSINKAINSVDSPLTSLLYNDSAKKLSGAHGIYEKTRADSYSWHLLSD